MSDWKREIGRLIVGALVIVMFGVVLGYMLWTKAGGVDILIGALAAAFGSVIGWWYASSKGSEDKTRLLAKADPIKDEE